MRSYPARRGPARPHRLQGGASEFAPFAALGTSPTIRSVTGDHQAGAGPSRPSRDVSAGVGTTGASLRMGRLRRVARGAPGTRFMPRLIVIFDEVQEILSGLHHPARDPRPLPLAILARPLGARGPQPRHPPLSWPSQSFGNLGPIIGSSRTTCSACIALRPGTGLVEGDEALMARPGSGRGHPQRARGRLLRGEPARPGGARGRGRRGADAREPPGHLRDAARPREPAGGGLHAPVLLLPSPTTRATPTTASSRARRRAGTRTGARSCPRG